MIILVYITKEKRKPIQNALDSSRNPFFFASLEKLVNLF